MSLFERYLTLWVALCIVAGIALGQLFPGLVQTVAGLEVAKVNLPVAGLIWLMIIPMLMKIDFRALSQVGRHWRGIGVTLFVNWAVKPFSMAALGALFIGHLFGGSGIGAFSTQCPAGVIDDDFRTPRREQQGVFAAADVQSPDADATADAMESQGAKTEDKMDEKADATRDKAEKKADAMEDKADAVRDQKK